VPPLRRIGADAGTLREAADALGRVPGPADEPAGRAERTEYFQRLVGATTGTQDLGAVLRAREWLQQLADETDD